MPSNPRSPESIARRILLTLVLLAVAVLIREVILFSFLAVLIATVFSFPVRWLARNGLNRGLAVVLSLLVSISALVGIGLVSYPVVSSQVQSIARQTPLAIDRLQSWYRHATSSGPMAQVEQQGKLSGNIQSGVSKTAETVAKAVFPAAVSVVGAVSTLILVLVLAAFLVYQPEAYRRGVRVLVPAPHLPAFDEGYERIAHGLRKWVGGILLSMCLMGTLTAIGLKIAGIENWLLLGIVTMIGTFVPYLGAICSAVPGLLMGLSQDTHHFFYAVVVYTGVHIVEGYIVQPWIMKRAVEIRPALLLFGQSAFGVLLGVPGIMVASPLLVCLQNGIEYFYVERRLGKRAPDIKAAA